MFKPTSEQIAIRAKFARPGHWSLEKDPDELSEIQSSYWGRSVKIRAVPGNPFNSSIGGQCAIRVFGSSSGAIFRLCRSTPDACCSSQHVRHT
jgi:hypothetical protein